MFVFDSKHNIQCYHSHYGVVAIIMCMCLYICNEIYDMETQSYCFLFNSSSYDIFTLFGGLPINLYLVERFSRNRNRFLMEEWK